MSLDSDHVQILLNIQADVAATKQAVLDLAGPTGRITQLEQQIATTNHRQWISMAVIGPIMYGFRELLRRLHI